MLRPSTQSLCLVVSIFSFLFFHAHQSTPGASAAIYDPPPRSHSSTSTSTKHKKQQQSTPHGSSSLPLSSLFSSSRWNSNTNKAYGSQREDTLNKNHASRHLRRHDIASIGLQRYRLSVSNQLDLLRLGFIPTEFSSSSLLEENKEDDDTNNDGMKLRNYIHIPRGGGNKIVEQNATITIHPSLKQQYTRYRARLAFIPTSSSLLTTSGKNNIWHIACFNRGGGGAYAGGSSAAPTMLQHRQQKNIIALSHPLPLASMFAFLAGYSNVLCYRKFQCYATMMTGNIVVMSMLLAEEQWMNALWRCSLVMCYLVGSIFVRSIESQCQKFNTSGISSSSTSSKGGTTMSQQQQQQHYRVIAPIVAAIFAIAQILLSSSRGEESMIFHFAVPILAIGYGIVHTSANRACNATMTQLLTGHITKLGSSFSDYMMLGSAEVGSSQPRSGKLEVRMSCSILASFVFGGIVGSKFLVGATEVPHFVLLGLIYASMLALC